MKKLIPAFFCLALVLPIKTYATEIYDYEAAVIESLGTIHDATAEFKSGLKNTSSDDPTAPLRDTLRATVLMRAETNHAALPLVKYEQSKDETISKSAQLMAQEFKALDTNFSVMETSLEKTLNDPVNAMKKQGTTHRQIYEQEASMNEAWNNLAMGTAITASALKNFDKSSDPNPYYLRVSEKERQGLKDVLLKRFGEGIKSPTTDQTSGDMVPGHLFWDFLNNPKWISADR